MKTLRHPSEPHPILQDSERTRCEIWTRVMGYHRPVSSFNTGKKGEFAERRYFVEPACPPSLQAEQAEHADLANEASLGKPQHSEVQDVESRRLHAPEHH